MSSALPNPFCWNKLLSISDKTDRVLRYFYNCSGIFFLFFFFFFTFNAPVSLKRIWSPLHLNSAKEKNETLGVTCLQPHHRSIMRTIVS